MIETTHPAEQPHTADHAAADLQEEAAGYNFLRNAWGAFRFDQPGISAEDKLDHLSKVVTKLKSQLTTMVTYETQQSQQLCLPSLPELALHSLQQTLESTQLALDQSKAKNEQLELQVASQQQRISYLQQEGSYLRGQLFELKQAKNRCDERVIELSTKIYQLERNELEYSQVCSREDEGFSLDQINAFSVEREEDHDQPRLSLMSKRGLVRDFSLYLCETNPQNENIQLAEMNVNLPIRERHPLKQSLQIPCNSHNDKFNRDPQEFITEMQRMRIKTQRLIEMENDRLSLPRHTSRPSLDPCPLRNDQKQRRFRRIR